MRLRVVSDPADTETWFERAQNWQSLGGCSAHILTGGIDGLRASIERPDHTVWAIEDDFLAIVNTAGRIVWLIADLMTSAERMEWFCVERAKAGEIIWGEMMDPQTFETLSAVDGIDSPSFGKLVWCGRMIHRHQLEEQ